MKARMEIKRRQNDNHNIKLHLNEPHTWPRHHKQHQHLHSTCCDVVWSLVLPRTARLGRRFVQANGSGIIALHQDFQKDDVGGQFSVVLKLLMEFGIDHSRMEEVRSSGTGSGKQFVAAPARVARLDFRLRFNKKNWISWLLRFIGYQ